MSCDCDPPTAPKTRPSDGSCGCTDKVEEGQVKLYVSGGNLRRNRIEGNPVRLPGIIIETSRGKTYADAVTILDADGRIVGRVIQDDTARPSVWIELDHPFVATIEGRPTSPPSKE